MSPNLVIHGMVEDHDLSADAWLEVTVNGGRVHRIHIQDEGLFMISLPPEPDGAATWAPEVSLQLTLREPDGSGRKPKERARARRWASPEASPIEIPQALWVWDDGKTDVAYRANDLFPRRAEDDDPSLVAPNFPWGWLMQYYALAFGTSFRRRSVKSILPPGAIDDMWSAFALGIGHSAFNPKTISLDRYQQLFDASLSVEAPSPCESDASLVDRMLNGIHPCRFAVPIDSKPQAPWCVELTWNDLDFDGHYELPNVKVELMPTDETLELAAITLTFRKAAYIRASDMSPAALEPPRRYEPGDGVTWRYAKRWLRSCLLLAGELDNHLTQGHLLTEQYQVPFERHLRDTVLEDLLWPHLAEVDQINHFGDRLIVGHHGILARASALTPTAVERKLAQNLGAVTWKRFAPRAPINQHDRFGHAAQIFYRAVRTHVRGYLSEHTSELALIWPRITRFSQDLVEHSTPYHEVRPPVGYRWLDSSGVAPGRNDPSRVTHDGQLRSMHPIRTLEDLEDFCTHAIFHATFMHHWCNDAQIIDGANLRYNTFGLKESARRPPKSNEDWDAWVTTALPDLPEAICQLVFAELLVAINHGRIMDDSSGSLAVLPSFREALEPHREVLGTWGLDIDQVRARVNS